MNKMTQGKVIGIAFGLAMGVVLSFLLMGETASAPEEYDWAELSARLTALEKNLEETHKDVRWLKIILTPAGFEETE